MRLRLPLSLFRALLCACCSFTLGTASLAGWALAPAFAAVETLYPYYGSTLETSSEIIGGVLRSSGEMEITIEALPDVTFSGNGISSQKCISGGVIANDATQSNIATWLTLALNGTVTFTGNIITSSNDGVGVRGGVLNNSSSNERYEGDVYIHDNGTVNFAYNLVSSSGAVAGGAVYNGSGAHALFLELNTEVGFIGNTVKARSCMGAALFGSGMVIIRNNAAVVFRDNSCEGGSASSATLMGGAVCLANNSDYIPPLSNPQYRSITTTHGHELSLDTFIADNHAVDFIGNHLTGTGSATSVYGGAIGNFDSLLQFVSNCDITFRDNYLKGTGDKFLGGAFYGGSGSDTYFVGNDHVAFKNNYVKNTSGASSTCGGAIALAGSGEFAMSGNKSLTFTGNYVEGVKGNVAGGALYNANGGKSVSLSQHKGNVSFDSNHASNSGAAAMGGAVYMNSNASEGIIFSLTENQDILVTNNEASGATQALGGALYFYNKVEFKCRDNAAVIFSGNKAMAGSEAARGGALYADTKGREAGFSGNSGAITFKKNEAVSTGGAAEGGAAYVGAETGLIFDLTSGIAFESNAATSEKKTASGGAVYVAKKLDISGQGDAVFRTNTAKGDSAYGGAVYATEGIQQLQMDVSGAIEFSGNTASAQSGLAQAGALYIGRYGAAAMMASDITFKENKAVSVSGDAQGGAHYQYASLTLQSSGSIQYIGNTAEALKGSAKGGAWTNYDDGGQRFTCMAADEKMEYRANHAIGAQSAQGGAIALYRLNSSSYLSAGKTLVFSGNTAECRGSGNAWGGAIDAIDLSGPYSLKQTAEVLFEHNAAVATTGNAYGGAISKESSSGQLMIEGNGSVRFIGNYAESKTGTASGGAIYANMGKLSIVGNGDVLFRGNYTKQGNTYKLSDISKPYEMTLSASAGKEIRFNGAVEVSQYLYLNQDYTDADAQKHASTGTIVFSGKYTKADLEKVKGGVAGTEDEILSSRTSTVGGALTLSNGRLLVEEHAVLEARELNANAGTMVEVKNASLTTTYSGTFTDCSVLLAKGGKMNFSNLTLNGKVTLEIGDFSDGEHTLISSSYIRNADNLDIRIADKYKDNYTLTWNNQQTVLTLTVRGVIPELSSRDEPMTHLWQATSGVLSNGAALGDDAFLDGDSLEITGNATVTISGTVKPAEMVVNSYGKVTLIGNKKVAESGIAGESSLTKDGVGILTLNAGNSYTGGTELNAGTIKATAADSFGTGEITVNGGTLDLASKTVGNAIILSGAATLKGDAKYAGNVTVDGKATLLAKTSYKGLTTIGEDSSLTLEAAATMAGNVALEGGTLTINNAKGMTLAKNQTMMLDGGTVLGLVTVGAGGTLAWQEGTMQNAPVLKGGTLDLGGKNALTLTGVKAQVQFGDKVIDLPGKGIVRSDETLDVLSGTVKLTMGKETTDAAITVSGNAALVNGATHSGDITVNGTLAKGTTIKLIDSKQTVELNGKGTMAGTISGVGSVNVNESIDATAAKLTAANISLNGGTFINTKGIKLAKGQTLTLNGASVNLGTKGILTTAAGSTLKVSESTTLSGSLTLGGGELVFEGAPLTVKGTLTLSKPVSVTGSGTLICDSVKPFKGDLGTLFGGADVKLDGTTLTINGGATKKSLVAAPVAEEEAPLVATPALPTVPEMPATNPVADAIAQADWGILDANRAFTSAVATRHQHAALLDKGRGAAWVSAFGTSVRHGNQGAHHGSDGNIEGAALGMEHSVSETGILGLAVGRSKNRIGATGVTHLRQETAHVALYGQKQLRNGLTADATAAWGDTETKLGGSSWQQKSAALSGRLTHAHMVNDATAVRTFGGLSYEATESGSFGAANRSGSVQNLRAEVGAGATHTAGKAHVYGEASLTGDLIRHNPSVEMGGIRHHGATPGRLGVKATLGAFYEITDTWTGTASYSFEAESRTTAHTLNLGVSKSF